MFVGKQNREAKLAGNPLVWALPPELCRALTGQRAGGSVARAKKTCRRQGPQHRSAERGKGPVLPLCPFGLSPVMYPGHTGHVCPPSPER